MRPTLWLLNDSGEIWNLRSKTFSDGNSMFIGLDGSGFEQKLTFTTVDDDFILTDEEATQVDITGTMYFASQKAISAFETFTGGYKDAVKLYYDPTGNTEPENEDGTVWYKQVRVAKMPMAEQDSKTSLWISKCTFTPYSAMWKKAITQVASVTKNSDDVHIYDYFYDFTYGSTSTLACTIYNEGAPVGCVIEIINISSSEIATEQWTLDINGTRYYALFNTSLPGADTANDKYYGLYVDSNPLTQECTKYIYHKSGEGYARDTDESSDSMVNAQEPNPQYINFITLGHGTNRIIFSGTDANVFIRVTFTKQTRAI